jgi:hypothetical protein
MIAMIMRDGVMAARMRKLPISPFHARVKASSDKPIAPSAFRWNNLRKKRRINAARIFRISLGSDCHWDNGLPLDQHLLDFAGVDYRAESHVHEKAPVEYDASDSGTRVAGLRGAFSSSGLQ